MKCLWAVPHALGVAAEPREDLVDHLKIYELDMSAYVLVKPYHFGESKLKWVSDWVSLSRFCPVSLNRQPMAPLAPVLGLALSAAPPWSAR